MKKTTIVLATVLALGAFARAGASQPAETAAGKLLGHYSTLYEALVAGSTATVAETAAKVAAEARAQAQDAAAAALYAALASAAERMDGKDLATTREQFKALTAALDGLLRASESQGWSLYYCPMADGYWIQTAEGVRNPYYGASMLKCGEKVPDMKKN